MSNANYYPSLEPCKKLTANWFPKTEKCWTRSLKWDEESKTFPYEVSSRPTPWGYYVCPSVMELFDEMPKEIYPKWLKHSLTILSDNNGIYAWRDYLTQYWVRYDTIDQKICINIHWWNLPNALAEMWIWLKENNYIN